MNGDEIDMAGPCWRVKGQGPTPAAPIFIQDEAVVTACRRGGVRASENEERSSFLKKRTKRLCKRFAPSREGRTSGVPGGLGGQALAPQSCLLVAADEYRVQDFSD